MQANSERLRPMSRAKDAVTDAHPQAPISRLHPRTIGNGSKNLHCRLPDAWSVGRELTTRYRSSEVIHGWRGEWDATIATATLPPPLDAMQWLGHNSFINPSFKNRTV